MLNLLSKAIYVSEQVPIGWCRTGAYYTAELTFSHDFPIQVWGAYHTSVRIIFEFLRYQKLQHVCHFLVLLLYATANIRLTSD